MNDERTLLVLFDAGCSLCAATARWLEHIDRGERLRVQPIPDLFVARGVQLSRDVLTSELHVIDARGRSERGFRAWRRILRELPVLCVFWPLLWLPGVTPLRNRVYRWVVTHRATLARALGI